MLISFRTGRLEKLCNSLRKAIGEWGQKRAAILRRRLDDLSAATSLEDMRFFTGDCHEYRHRKDHTFTLDLDGGYRLFFQPMHDPVPILSDGVSVDWTKVTAIVVTGVEDPHD